MLRILLVVVSIGSLLAPYGAWAVEVSLSISDVFADPGDRGVAIPILLKNETVAVRAVQIVMAYDPDLVEIADFQGTDRTSNMDMVTANVAFPGDLRAVIIDFGTDLIAPGSGAIATLLIDVFDSTPATAAALIFITEDGPDGQSTKVVGEDTENLPLSVDNGTMYIGGVSTAVGENGSSDLPLVDAVAQNFPNPFNADTHIRWKIGESGPVTLKVYSVSAQMVRTLIDGSQQAGSYSVWWDGRDDSGLSVGTGIYMYRLERAGSAITKKMILLR